MTAATVETLAPYRTLPDCRLYVADVRAALAALPADSVHCVVTSIPFYALRDYEGPPVEWGGDPDHDHAFEPGAHRFASRNGAALAAGVIERPGGSYNGRGPRQSDFCACGAWRGQLGLEPTPDLFVEHVVEVFCAVRRVMRPDATLWLNVGDSFATHASKRTAQFNGAKLNDGRNDVFTRARTPAARFGLKEKDLIMVPARVALALQAAGFWLRSEIIWSKPAPMPEPVHDRPAKSHESIYLLTKAGRYYYNADEVRDPGGRHCRDVWTIPPEPLRDEHFAAFPTALPTRAILAGTSERVCAECGAPWRRENAWRAGCSCGGQVEAAIVLDPFGGSGTTNVAARRLGRRSIYIDSKTDYADIAIRRLAKTPPRLGPGI